MNFADIAGFLKSSAPTIATALTGPAGGLVVSMLAQKLGVEDTVDAVGKVLSATKNDPEFAARLQEVELEYVKLAYQNTGKARDMQVAALQQADLFSKRFVAYLSSFWSVMAVAYIGFVTFTVIPDTNVRFVDTILGFLLGTVVATVLNFWLGSSVGSRAKDKA